MGTEERPKNHAARSSKERKIHRRLLPRFVMLIILATVGLYGMSFMAAKPNNLGLAEGKLAACPDTPNCVSTQATKDSQKMEPVAFSTPVPDTVEKIKSTIATSFSRARLAEEQEQYLRYEFTSLIFRFIDDVEFWFDDQNKLIHFRSASRVGHSDLGANRKRMSKLFGIFRSVE